MASPTLEQLNQRFGLPGLVSFDQGSGGLTRLVVTAPAAQAHVYLYGANLTHWQPTGQAPVLFLSGKSDFEAGKPIRGGVPICFPWFGMGPKGDKNPLHGFVRLREWTVKSVKPDTAAGAAGGVVVELELESDHQTQGLWDHAFVLQFRLRIGATLSMELVMRNKGGTALRFEEALHTYFAVSDVRRICVRGLEGAKYLDRIAKDAECAQNEPIKITGETGRLYLNTIAACALEDPGLSRRVVIEKSNSRSTLIWNPWIDKAKAMPDFGDDEWPNMICVETVNALANTVTLDPGRTHSMTARIRVEKM